MTRSLVAAVLALGLACLLGALGCGTALDKARIATTAASDLGLSTARFVADLNEQKEYAIVSQLEIDGDAAKARAARTAWRKTYDHLDQAVKTYGAAVSSVRAGVELAASSKKLDLGKVLAELLKVGQALKAALSTFGVELPGGSLIP